MQSPTSTLRTAEPTSPSRWNRFLGSVLPAAGPDRLVRVADVSRGVLPLVEGSLADVEITPVIQEIRGLGGASHFVVLVSAPEAEIASDVLAGF